MNILKRFVYSENHSLIRLFRLQLSLIRGDFERKIVWSGVTFKRTVVWSGLIVSAPSSGQWSGFGLGHGRTIFWTMVWFGSDQRSFPSGKVWSETASSAHRAHTLFQAHFSLISGHFGLARSVQKSHPDGTSTWVRVEAFYYLDCAIKVEKLPHPPLT